ncbi:MAG TPA: hypothetical protein VHF90_04910 [Thermoleophilaceae bacterium]|nr:hypothetical protein [Thermoleophilaceae bacterium]
MPRQRWREQVLEELRGSRADIRALGDRQESSLRELRDANERMLRRFTAEHRDAVRDMKASVDRNTEVTDRCAEVLSGLVAQVASHESRVDDMVEQIGAQTSALLALIDEIRGQNGLRGGPNG